VIVVVAGAVGFALLAVDDGDSSEVALDAGTALPQMPTTTMTIPIAGSGWSCSGYLGSDGVREYYSDCFQTTGASGQPALCPEPTTTIPMTTIPLTTILDGTVGTATGDAVACNAAQALYEQQCFANMTTITTSAMATTTTSFGVAIGTVPEPHNATEEAVACETYSPETSTTTTTMLP
jgi:hypothetical protein